MSRSNYLWAGPWRMPRRAPAMGGSRVFQGRIAPGHSPRCQRLANQSLLETDVDREVPEHGLGAAGVRGVTGCAGVGGDGDPTATDADMHLGSRALLADPDVDSVAGCRYANRGACDRSRRALRRIGCSASSRLATSRICGGSVYARAQVRGVSVSYPIRR